VKAGLRSLVAAAGRNRTAQRTIVKAAVVFADGGVIRPNTAQTIVRLADQSTRDVYVSRRFQVEERGVKLDLELPARNPAALRLMFEDVYKHPTEGRSLRVFAALARRAQCVCDVGAHVGLYTYVAAAVRQSPRTRIFAFEPLPDLSETIQRNILQNGLNGVAAVSAAAGDQPGRAELFIPEDQHYATLERGWLDMHHIQQFRSVSVNVIQLDAFFTKHGPPLPDLVKVDVEGHEEAVLQGMRGILASSAPDLIIELIGEERSMELTRWLSSELGYRVLFIGDELYELAPGEAPPAGALHNFLITRHSDSELPFIGTGVP
jgi:FkbM family methyltransferase